MNTQILLIIVIALSLVFTYTNGFQDGSSVTATAIASRSLSPFWTVLFVAGLEFLGAILGGSAVANTIQSVTSWQASPDLLPPLASGLAAAIIWNYLTRLMRFPSSSTHALVGGILGAIISASGSWHYIVLGNANNLLHPTGLCKVVLSLFVSPLLGFCAGYIFLLVAWILLLRATTKINKIIKWLQWLTTGVLAYGHGANDTQKAMGIIILALQAAGLTNSNVIPLWVRIATGIAMSLGVISIAYGIVKRVGSDIYKIHPLQALMSQFASACIVLTGSNTGGPVSATQVIASTVAGVGAAERKKGVHWLVVKDMLLAWFLTIPGAALLAAFLHQLAFHWLF